MSLITILWFTLEDLRSAMKMDEREFSALMGMTARQYRTLKESGGAPTALAIGRLADALQIGFEDLFDDHFDIQAAAERYRAGFDTLPEKYAVAAYSRRRTSAPILAYTEMFMGNRVLESVLGDLRVSRKVFQNHDDDRINVLFPMDLCTALENRGIREKTFFNMGLLSARLNRAGDMGLQIQRAQGVKEVYEILFSEQITQYDENFHYRVLKLDETGVRVSIHCRENVQDMLKLKILGNQCTCRVRAGVGASYPQYLGLPDARFEERRCVHQGDSHCEYVFDYSKALDTLKSLH